MGPGYKNPWIQANSTKYFTYLDYDKIYDFDSDPLKELSRIYKEIQKTGGLLLPKFEESLVENGYKGYVRQKEVKYFFPVLLNRDYEVESIPDTGAEKFWDSLMVARRAHESSGSDKQLTSYSVKEYRLMKLFLGRGGEVGFALQGDNIVSVFSHPILAPRALPNLMDVAVRNGGRRVDVFDTYLPKLYSREGFKPVATLPWNDEYAPEGWDYSAMKQYNNGRPNVVFMVYDPSSKIPGVSSYEEAEKIQRDELEKVVV